MGFGGGFTLNNTNLTILRKIDYKEEAGKTVTNKSKAAVNLHSIVEKYRLLNEGREYKDKDVVSFLGIKRNSASHSMELDNLK